MKLRDLRQYKILLPLFFVRDYVWKYLGLFWLKARIKRFFFYKRLIREDVLFKQNLAKEIELLPNNYIADCENVVDVVVSLTSYGKRVYDSLPYTLYSILKQSLIPKYIVVYLDGPVWNMDNIPYLLKKLNLAGVQVVFVNDDIRSYTKLLPALKQFPDLPIITIDDDIFYNERLVEWLYKAYENSDKRTVLGMWGCIVGKDNNSYIPYNQWKDCKYGEESSEYSIYGCQGCIYPPKIFDDEIFNSEVFKRLAPTADDLWFWLMEKRLNISVRLTEPHGYGYHRSVNRIEEYDLNQKGTLMYQNVANGKNNAQLKALLEYYGL